MEYLFDTVNLADIQKYSEIFPITGITSNPSIIKAEGKIDFFAHFKAIREIIGQDKTLHVQVLARDHQMIIKEAHTLLNKIDRKVVIKIPVTQEGLQAIRILKGEGVAITATAIYTKAQGFLAIKAGADYLAPYFNRMENMDINPREVIEAFSEVIERNNYSTKILAASFKNMAQVNDAFIYGAHAATLPVAILTEAFKMAAINKAVDDFEADWVSLYGQTSLCDL